MVPAQPLQPIAPQAVSADLRPHFFEKGGLGGKIANGIGDFAMYLGAARGNPLGTALMRQQQDQRENALRQAELDRRNNKPQIHFGENGLVQRFNPETGAIEVINPGTPDIPKPPAMQQQIEYLRTLKPDISPDELFRTAQRAISGYGYSDEARTAKVSDQIAVADHRLGNSQQLKATPTYAGLHPKAAGGGGMFAGKIHGRSKSNPMPVNSKEQLMSVPPGTWVSLPNGQVTQRR